MESRRLSSMRRSRPWASRQTFDRCSDRLLPADPRGPRPFAVVLIWVACPHPNRGKPLCYSATRKCAKSVSTSLGGCHIWPQQSVPNGYFPSDWRSATRGESVPFGSGRQRPAMGGLRSMGARTGFSRLWLHLNGVVLGPSRDGDASRSAPRGRRAGKRDRPVAGGPPALSVRSRGTALDVLCPRARAGRNQARSASSRV